jgi:hypothetical protein
LERNGLERNSSLRELLPGLGATVLPEVSAEERAEWGGTDAEDGDEGDGDGEEAAEEEAGYDLFEPGLLRPRPCWRTQPTPPRGARTSSSPLRSRSGRESHNPHLALCATGRGRLLTNRTIRQALAAALAELAELAGAAGQSGAAQRSLLTLV